MIGWIFLAAVLAAMIWGLWPQITGLFNIRANDGDDRVVNIKSVTREMKRDLKKVKRKLTR